MPAFAKTRDSDASTSVPPSAAASGATSSSFEARCNATRAPEHAVSTVIGVCKAYATRAQRWFPTEITLDDAVAEHLRPPKRETGPRELRRRKGRVRHAQHESEHPKHD